MYVYSAYVYVEYTYHASTYSHLTAVITPLTTSASGVLPSETVYWHTGTYVCMYVSISHMCYTVHATQYQCTTVFIYTVLYCIWYIYCTVCRYTVYTVLYVNIQYILYCMSIYSIYCTVCQYIYLKRPEWLGISDISQGLVNNWETVFPVPQKHFHNWLVFTKTLEIHILYCISVYILYCM